MRFIKTILALLCAAVLLFVGILLTVNNQEHIRVDLVFVSLPEASIASWLMAAFMGGALFSFLLGGVAIFALRTRLRGAQRKIRTAERQLDELRTAQLNNPA